MATFNDFAADLTLTVIKFLNVVDSGRLAVTSQRYYYLVKEYQQQRGAELVAVANANISKEEGPTEKLISQSKNGLQSKPNLILSFSTEDTEMSEAASKLEDTFGLSSPTPTVLLGAEAYAIQVNNAQRSAATATNALEHASTLSLMAVNFPGAKVLPFYVTHAQREVGRLLLERQLRAVGDLTTWKAMIVYAAGDEGHEMVESFIKSIQRLLPGAAIVGGICNGGYITMPHCSRDLLMGLSVAQLRTFPESRGFQFIEKSELVDHIQSTLRLRNVCNIDEGLFGVVLGGDVPVKSVVSRGVKGVFHRMGPINSPFVVEQAELVGPDDDDYMFEFGSRENASPYHLILTIRDTETQETITAMQLLAKGISAGRRAEFIGLKRPGSDGFELENLHHVSAGTGALVVFSDDSQGQSDSLKGAQIDLFHLDGASCMQDMDETVNKLKEQTEGEEILGAIMFSCAGRGPERGHLIPEEMSDATRFAKGFPKVPCLGFYAGGEIGPLALAGNEKVFQTGRAAVQGVSITF
jgi:small ligand-binding sensory domain FIST